MILSALTARLKGHDKLFMCLEDLAAGVKSSDGDASIMRQTSELSAALAQYVAEEIYCRLDRIYLQKILDSSRADAEAPTDEENEVVHGLEQEMDSLYPEIDILSEMSTKQQYMEPILRQLQNHHGQLRIRSHRKLDFVRLFACPRIIILTLSGTRNNYGLDSGYRQSDH